MLFFFLLSLIVLIYSVSNGVFRQVWRNSKFLDELKKENQANGFTDITELIDPDK